MTCVILTVMATESKRGGKRDGAGRKPSANPATKLMTIKMTPEQHAQFLALGGARWLKKVLIMDEFVNKSDVIKMLQRLLDQAREVEAAVGAMPTAVEALGWAIDSIDELVVKQ